MLTAAAVYYSIEVMLGKKGMTQARWGGLTDLLGVPPPSHELLIDYRAKLKRFKSC